MTLYALSTKTDSKQTMLLLEDIASKTKSIGFLNYLQELDEKFQFSPKVNDILSQQYDKLMNSS